MKKIYFLLIALLCSATMAFAYDSEIDGIYYDFDHENKTAIVTHNEDTLDDMRLEIIIPEKVIYNEIEYSVTSIGEDAFYNCSSLKSITLPNSVTSIGGSAFYNCSSLKSITLPNSVTSIGYSTFSRCSSLTSITIPDGVTSIGGSAFSCTPWLEKQPDGCVYINNCLYVYKGEVPKNTHIDIKEGTIQICGSAFYNCSSLKSITLPNSVTSIGNSAFSGCTSLTSITIPDGVTSIGDYAFRGCSSLTSIEIEAQNPPVIDNYTFEGVSRSIQIKVPCGSKAKYQIAEYWRGLVNYEEVPVAILSVDVNDKTMGFATITKPNSCTDDVAQVQAQALAGYKFVRWSDGATENPHILLVTEDMTITAEFAKEGAPEEDVDSRIFIAESADETQGMVKVMVVAEAIEGFEFSHWSDGNTENPRIVSLDADVELYAYFKASTDVENSRITSAVVYSNNGVLYVDGVVADYHVLDAAGRLVYSGSDAALALPRGVYVVAVGGEVEKVVL